MEEAGSCLILKDKASIVAHMNHEWPSSPTKLQQLPALFFTWPGRPLLALHFWLRKTTHMSSYWTDYSSHVNLFTLLHCRLNWLLVAGYWHNKWFRELNSLSLSSALPANLQRPHLLAAMIVIQLACPLTGEILRPNPVDDQTANNC